MILLLNLPIKYVCLYEHNHYSTIAVSYTHLDVYKRQMLRAVRGQLGSESGRKLDVILKMLEARRIADRLK